MSAPSKNPVAMPGAGTSLVDRMNISIHLRKYIKLVTRRWWILALAVVAGTSYSYYKAHKMPDVFQASSTLGIPPQVETGYKPRDVVQEENNNYFDTQIQYMMAVTSRVEEKLKDYRTLTGQKPSASASAFKGTGATFGMTVTGSDFEYVRRYAEEWPHEFLNFKNEMRGNLIDKNVLSTRQEMARYQELLDKNRAKIQEFLRDHNVGSAKDTGDAAQQLLDKLNTEYTEIVTQRKRLENKSTEELAADPLGVAVRKKNGTAGTTNAAPAAVSDSVDPLARFSGESRYVDLKFQQQTKQMELAKYQEILKPKHPFLIKLKHDVEEVDRQLQFQFEMINEKRRASIESLKKDEASYLPLIEAQNKIVIDSRGVQLQYEKLKEDELNYKTVIISLQKNLQVIDLTPSNEGRIEIVAAGVGSPGPIGPDRSRIILNGFLMGLGIGIAIVYLLHRLDDRLELAEDIEAELEEPVLGQIPQQDVASLRDGRVLVTELEQHNLFSEAIRGVRSAVMFGTSEKPKQVLIVTSAVPGDGKTTFTVNFAATLANAGNRILLVDADLRRGNVHNYFMHPREAGLAELLSGELHWNDVVRATPLKTLQVITTGHLPPNPGELLISPVMQEFLDQARKEYDHILFDCPPLTAIDDTFCLLNLSDGLLFVVKAGQTSMRFAKNALMAVRQRGAEIFGVVLNGITTDHPSYYYNYYYHAYYNKDAAPGSTKTVRPATKMAARRRSGDNSIAAQAQARVGHETDTDEIAAEERRKAEEFKARRASQRQSPANPADTTPVKPGENQTGGPA